MNESVKNSSKMNKKVIPLAVAVVILGGGVLHFTRKDDKAPTAEAAQNTAASAPAGKGRGEGGPTVVSVVAAAQQDVPVVLQANGSVTPLKTVELHPQTSAVIRQVHIREGQSVAAGALLFTLDDRNDRANVEKAQAQVARDQATLADLQRQLSRSRDLVAQKFIAQNAVDTLASQVEAQRALVRSNAAAAQSAQVLASYNSIRAPMAGRVGAIDVHPGALVQPATKLVTVTQLDPISVGFTLPEASLQALLDAQRAGPVTVRATLSNGKTIDGALSFVDNMVDPQAGAIRVKAQFGNRDTALWPGQYVNTEITVQTLKDAVVVPLQAVITNAKGTMVYTVADDQTAKANPVKVLHSAGNLAAVSGVAPGDKVIVDGKQNLRPGGKVKVAAPAGGKGEGKGGKGREGKGGGKPGASNPGAPAA
jgi:multidrug efflux system membrane fusion protein